MTCGYADTAAPTKSSRPRVFLDGERYTVIGMMPSGFEPFNSAELWLPHGPLPERT